MRISSRQSRHVANALHSLGISWPAGLKLLVWRDRLETSACRTPRRIRGAYDPSLNRIELFDCTPATPDVELVRRLLHERAHAAGIRLEHVAVKTADGALERLGPGRVAALARTLRCMAQSRPDSAAMSTWSCCPLSIG